MNIHQQPIGIGKNKFIELFEWTESVQFWCRVRERTAVEEQEQRNVVVVVVVTGIGYETVDGQNRLRETG